MNEQKRPLWEAMRVADASWTSDFTDPEARAIIAVRDWLLPEESIEDAPGRFVNGCCLEERQRLRALLTDEAYRSELRD